MVANAVFMHRDVTYEETSPMGRQPKFVAGIPGRHGML